MSRMVTRADVEALAELVMELSRAEAAAEGMESPVRRYLSQAAQFLGAAQAAVATRELHAAIGRSTPHATLDVPCSRCAGRTFPPYVRADGSLSAGYYCERDGVVTVVSSTGVVVELSDGSGGVCADAAPALRVVSAVTW